MSKPRQCVAFGNRCQSQLECLDEFIQRARPRGAETGLDFRPAFFDRVEVGRVGRQELDVRTAGTAIFDDIDGELDYREITPHKWPDFEIGSPLEWQNWPLIESAPHEMWFANNIIHGENTV